MEDGEGRVPDGGRRLWFLEIAEKRVIGDLARQIRAARMGRAGRGREEGGGGWPPLRQVRCAGA